jgi:hypothetical protein
MHRASVVGCACPVEPMAVEAVEHLRSARLCLERFAVSEGSTTLGRDFPQVEEATRAIHTALIALRECALTR